ncbi:DUF3291 domain-containing protein [Cytobacillus oceanisediminis]|uniref:DUF3291 domain-containing protein n=1 Tax=Cytobacillus oceanisediminis TaxID=665099 RepID=UPI001F550CA1|nr:DUF3291 domain-containing protein [Cytobacillus oceanisediminis]
MIKGEGSPILTLTVWKSLLSLYRFTYSGLHKQALQDRNKWLNLFKSDSLIMWYGGRRS